MSSKTDCEKNLLGKLIDINFNKQFSDHKPNKTIIKLSKIEILSVKNLQCMPSKEPFGKS